MKKIVLFLTIFILCLNNIFSHDNEYVHQRIIIEAYKLLKIQLSKESSGIADIDEYIGTISKHDNSNWYEIKNLTGGADHEDRKDIVYGYWLPTASMTHFWDADNPNGKMRLYGGGWYESAYTKSCTYIWDNFTKIFKVGISGGYKKLWCKGDASSYLYQYYWKDRIWVNYSHSVYRYNFGIPNNPHKNYEWVWGQQKSRELFFNILGRLCHLLMDMGVPEHIRRSYHVTDWFGEYTSPLEHWLKNNNDKFRWTAKDVYDNRGGFINPFCELNGDNNLFLYYTLSQLSDWFVNFGHLPNDGNDNYDHNVGEIHSILTSYAPDDEKFRITPLRNPGGVTQLYYSAYWAISDNDAIKFRDVLLPYTIRVIAGMLYKYIIEAKMQFPEETESDMGSIYDQQQELSLFNQDIDGNHYTFRAEGDPGRITVCSENRPEGYAADFKIGANARNVTFRASKEIIFKSGFIAHQGSQVHAYLKCNCTRESQPGNCKQCLDEDYNPQYDKSGQ